MARRMMDQGMVENMGGGMMGGGMMNQMNSGSPPPSMGKMFGRGSPETAPQDNSDKRSKSEAFYIHPPGNCGSCSHFIQGGDCELVDRSSEGFDSGVIDEGGWCSLYEGGDTAPKSPTSPKEKELGIELIEPSSNVPDWEEYPEEVAA